MAGRRPRDAWQQTTRTWRTELAYGCVGGLLSIAILAGTGWPKDGFVTAAIPVVSAVGAAIFVPLGQFLWRLLWQPWNDLKSRVGEISADASPMSATEQTVVTLRNYVRTGFELEAVRHVSREGSYETSEKDELEDWTHNVVTCLWEYGTKEQAKRFIEADSDVGGGFAAHRDRAKARLTALLEIVEELDPPRD